MVLETVVLTLFVTAYCPNVKETDSSPFHTSIGQHVHSMGCAVSQDLLASGKVKYGDYICIEGVKCCVVNDTMHERHMNAADVWVPKHEDERQIPPKKRQVVRIRGKQ
jgi:3D (Asp-Asp-Asp) domain-containing protein